jgi:hypothetical protein
VQEEVAVPQSLIQGVIELIDSGAIPRVDRVIAEDRRDLDAESHLSRYRAKVRSTTTRVIVADVHLHLAADPPENLMHIKLEKATEMDRRRRVHEPLPNLRTSSLWELEPPAIEHLAGSASWFPLASVESLMGRCRIRKFSDWDSTLV